MTYFQVIYAYGIDAFFARAQQVGANGCIIPDVPYDSSDGQELLRVSSIYGIFLVPIVTSTTPVDRLVMLSQTSSPIIYALSSHMTTGSELHISKEFGEYISKLRQYFSQQIYV